MAQARYKPLTLQEFLELPETEPAGEYIDGQVIQKPMPKGRHSRLQGKLCAATNQVAEEPKVAYAFPELRCPYPAGSRCRVYGGRSIVPDVAVFRWNQVLPALLDLDLILTVNQVFGWLKMGQ